MRRVARLGALLAVAALMAIALLAIVRSTDEQPSRPAATAPVPSTTTPPDPPDDGLPAGRGLAVGLGESNANLLWSEEARPELPDPAMDAWRDRVEALRPAYYRLLVDWAALQPDPAHPPDLSRPEDGCLRGQAPCGAYEGLRDRLRAVRSQQEAHGGWRIIVTIYGVPDWAAQGASGCEVPATLPRSRPISDRGIDGYRALIRAVADAGREEGVALEWWSPWNEPNGAYFVSPQRAACDAASPPLSPAVYARLVGAAREELRAFGTDHRLLLGELAGNRGPSPSAAGIAEFVRALPDDVACAASAWAQHEYAQREATGSTAPVDQLRAVLDERPCTRGARIWVTETGIGNARNGQTRDTSPEALRGDCRAMADRLRRWHRDPRVPLAIQYTFREDTLFPVGLADAALTRTYPTYPLWRAWGRREGPDAPAPDVCSG